MSDQKDFIIALLKRALKDEFDESTDAELIDEIIKSLGDNVNPYTVAITFLIATYSSVLLDSGSYSFGQDKVDLSKIPAAIMGIIAQWRILESNWNANNNSFIEFVDSNGTYSDRMFASIGVKNNAK